MTNQTVYLTQRQDAALFREWLATVSAEDAKQALTDVANHCDAFGVGQVANVLSAVLGWGSAFTDVCEAPEQLRRVLDRAVPAVRASAAAPEQSAEAPDLALPSPLPEAASPGCSS